MPHAKRGETAPPTAAERPHENHAHGVTWRDDYAWVRAENWREVLRDPAQLPADIRALLEAENAYADEMLGPTRTLQKQLVREMRARLKEDDSEVPQTDGPYAYYSRFRHGGQHRIFCRRPRIGGKETILLDGDERAAERSFFHLNTARHSPDHRKLAWSADDKGSEMYAIAVRDIAGGADLADLVENATGEVVWTRDSAAYLYVALDRNHRPWRVMLHRLGTPSSEDAEIFEEADPAWFIAIAPTRLGRSAVISVHGHDASEARIVDLDDPAAPPRLIAPRRPGLRYDVMDHGDRFFITTNSGGASDFKIVTASRDAPGEENWRPFVAHQEGRLIESAALFKDYLVLLAREENTPRLVIHEFASGEAHEIAFEAQTYFLRLETVYEFDTPVFRFGFSSMTCSQEIYDYDVGERQRILRKKQMTPVDFDAAAYVTRLVFASADDGERVPISLLYRRGAPLDGTAPLLIYGYGAYGHVVEASFSTNRLSLVDRGFVYAIAHVRGGTERGWRWYEDGKLAKKPNTFSDFIAATRHLVAEGFAAPDRVVAHGGSAGGMLMGAIANSAPALYAGVIADVPFVDVLNTMMDETLPLTPPEWLEWGDPIRSAEAFATIRGYSPYDNVRAQRYPAILALAGLTDPRVTYWEPAKWVARLRVTMTGGGPIILRTAMDAGHAGAPGRFDRLEDVARAYAFAIACVDGQIGERQPRAAEG
ncbi:MAG TPA: S9 family peptidase [Roseiarcus sp.]